MRMTARIMAKCLLIIRPNMEEIDLVDPRIWPLVIEWLKQMPEAVEDKTIQDPEPFI